MPPRFAYWTILVDDQPTAFRAKEAEELLPTFNRLKEKHPSAVMRWFQAGKLWGSRQEAQDAFVAARRDAAAKKKPASAGPPRDRKWRPGGTHQDPRQKYKDARKAKWTRFKDRIRQRADARATHDPDRPPRRDDRPPKPPGAGGPPWRSGTGDRPRSGGSNRPWQAEQRDRPGPPRQSDRPKGPKNDRPRPPGRGDRPWQGAKGDRPGQGARGDRPWKGAKGDRPGPSGKGHRPRPPGRPDRPPTRRRKREDEE
jgi:hypothetical protein